MQSLSPLAEQDREILYLALMDASASVAKLAAAVGCKPHVVQAALTKFHSTGLISRRVMVDAFRLGLSRHSIYISLSKDGQEKCGKVSEFLVDHPATSVVLEVAGDYDFFVAILVRDSGELAQFQLAFASAFPSATLRMDIAVTIRHSVYGEKSLLSDKRLYRECTFAMGGRQFEADEVERRILFRVCDSVFRGSAQLSRRLGMPASTVEYRLKKLRERGIICGDMYEVRGELLGLSNFIVLVQMKGVSDVTHTGFISFARLHPHITHLSFEVGYWDYQLGVAVQEVEQLNALIEEVQSRFSDQLVIARAIPMFKARKVRDYPFDPSYPHWSSQPQHAANL